jgi:hypothetical protein
LGVLSLLGVRLRRIRFSTRCSWFDMDVETEPWSNQ